MNTTTYKPLPIAVSRHFRDLVLSTYPALWLHPNAAAYRSLMQYVLFSNFLDEPTGRLILPYDVVAALVGVHPHAQGFRASDWIDQFSHDVLPLRASDYRYVLGQARMVSPELNDCVRAARQEEIRRSDDDAMARVWFDSGVPVSRRNTRDAFVEHEQYLMGLSQAVSPDHPARELVDFLLHQPQDCLTKILNRNWPTVQAMVSALPETTAKEKANKDWCVRLMVNLNGFRRMYYKDSDKTARISAAGASIHQLPRAMRKAAFDGAVECDLKSAQLAVVARLWDIPDLQQFLEACCAGTGPSIWDELLGHVGLPSAFKPIIKRTVYSIVFGMGRANLAQQLADGTVQDNGIGEAGAKHVLTHPLMKSLLTARGQQKKAVWEASGAEDAWGRWVPTAWNPATKKKDVPSVLASVVQSYEMRLMLSVLPVIKSERQMYLLSWLHDGITIHLGDHTKAQRQIVKLQDTVQREARALGMATYLEVQHNTQTPH